MKLYHHIIIRIVLGLISSTNVDLRMDLVNLVTIISTGALCGSF